MKDAYCPLLAAVSGGRLCNAAANCDRCNLFHIYVRTRALDVEWVCANCLRKGDDYAFYAEHACARCGNPEPFLACAVVRLRRKRDPGAAEVVPATVA